MARISYLWKNRVKFRFGSKNFFRAWAKRFFTFKTLVMRNRNRNFLVRRGAKIDETAEIGEAKIQGDKHNFQVGKFASIGKASILVHDRLKIGSNVVINDGVQILTASHDINDPGWKLTKREIIIGDYSWIATNAIILPGVSIGEGAVIGAGSVVANDVPPYTIAVGNPAYILEKKRNRNLVYNPCEFLAANNAWING